MQKNLALHNNTASNLHTSNHTFPKKLSKAQRHQLLQHVAKLSKPKKTLFLRLKKLFKSNQNWKPTPMAGQRGVTFVQKK